jgi:hypothetical protein
MRLSFDNNGEPLGSFDDGVTYSIQLMAELLGVPEDSFSMDAATEEYEGDVMAVMSNLLVAAMGDDWLDIVRATRKPGALWRNPSTGVWETAVPLPYPHPPHIWLWKRLTGWRDEQGRKARM